jgi:hypothetical protein
MAGPGFRSKLSFARLKAGGGFRWLGFETEVLKRKVAHSYWFKTVPSEVPNISFPHPQLPGVTPAQGKALKSIFNIIREISQTGGAFLFPLPKIWQIFEKKKRAKFSRIYT